MKKKLLSVAALLLVSVVQAQVGIGTSTPNKSSELTIMSRDKGVLIPNIALKSTVDKTTIANGNVESLLVYANTKQGDIIPGFYYWDKTKWVRIVPDVDIADEVIKSFATIINNESVVQQLEQVILHTEGSVFYDGNKFEYIDENGVNQIIDITQIIRTNETKTTLVDNNDGTYTYTSEDGTQTIINVPQSVIEQFASIVNNESVKQQLEEIILHTQGSVFYDGIKFEYVDLNGVHQIIDISHIVRTNETVTTLINNQNGTYTYTSEHGILTTINVPQSVIEQFENIVSNEAVLERLQQIVLNTGGNVYFDGTKFEYNDENGNRQSVDILTIVKANETQTVLVDNQNGTYVYTSENGTQTTINVPQSIIEQFENIVSNDAVLHRLQQIILDTGGNVYFDGAQFEYNDADGNRQIINILDLVRANETKTTLVDNQNGTYTYTSENGIQTTINVPQSVVEQFENIIKNETVLPQLQQFILESPSVVQYNGTVFEYIDTGGFKHLIDVNKIVTDNETLTALAYNTTTGILTYTNEHGNTVSVDVKNAVKSFETVSSITSNATAGTITFTNERGTNTILDIRSLVKANETVTKLVDHGNGSFTYYNEKGIDNNGNVITTGGTTFKVPKVEKYDLTKTIRFVDGTSTSQGWSYNEMNMVLGPNPQIYRRSNETYKTVYRALFSVNSNPARTKYIHVDFTVRATSANRINNAIGAVEVFAMFDVEIFINGELMKTMNERIFYFGGNTRGWDSSSGEYSSMIAFTDETRLNTSGNTIDIRIKPTRNNFFKNAVSTESGYFVTGNAMVVDVVLEDNLEINLFEKQ